MNEPGNDFLDKGASALAAVLAQTRLTHIDLQCTLDGHEAAQSSILAIIRGARARSAFDSATRCARRLGDGDC